jgi:hypothetical protein
VLHPSNVSTFDVGALFDDFLGGINGASGGSSDGYSESSSGSVDGTLGG